MRTIMWFGFVLGALSAAGKVILTKPGGSATLECGVNSYTSSLVWQHENNMIITIDGKSGFNRKGNGDIVPRSKVKLVNLDISGVKKEDAGRFTCVADGKSHEHALLVVSVWASTTSALQLGTEATLHCQVEGLDQGTTVQWKRPDESQTGLHTVQLKSVTSSDAGTWKCTFSYDGELYNKSLDIKVEVPAPKTTAPVTLQDSKDVSKPTCPGCVTPTSGALLLGLSWWVWVAAGVGCLVVLLLMVFVIVLCKRIRRRKRKLQKMKYDRQLLKSKPFCQCNCPAAAEKPQQGRRKEKPSALPLQPQLMESHERQIEERRDRQKERNRERGGVRGGGREE